MFHSHIDHPLVGKPICPSAHLFCTREHMFNALFQGHSSGFKVKEEATVRTGFAGGSTKMSPWYANAITGKETGEVNVPAIIDEAIGKIHAAIDPVTGKKKGFRQL